MAHLGPRELRRFNANPITSVDYTLGRFSIAASLLGALIIQSINTGILLSGFPPEFNLIIKAVIIVVILVIQSPRIQDVLAYLTRASRRSRPPESQQPAATAGRDAEPKRP